jgi:hypothetical protein
MRRRDISKVLFASAAGSTVIAQSAEPQTRSAPPYARTAVEIAAGVMPTNLSHPADPYVDPRRYGADPTGTHLSTQAVQSAINVAYAAKGCLWIGNGCNFLVGALHLTLTGDDTDDGFRIMGSSVNGSALSQSGTPSALLTLSARTPAGPQQAPVVLENFSLIGTGVIPGSIRTCDGLVLAGLAGVLCDKINLFGFNRCIYGRSVLELTLRDCQVSRSQYGVFLRTDGAGAPPNLIRIQNCAIEGCSLYGVDYDTGTELQITACDMEQNGVAATCAANPAFGATTATLTTPWILPSGAYACSFPDGEARTIMFTNNSTAIRWAGGLAAAQTAAWIATPTGAIHIGGAINGAPTFGLAKVWLENNWIEANVGGWTLQVDAPTLNQVTWISIRGGHVISSGHGLAVRVSGAGYLRMEDFFSASGDTWNLTATYAVLSNVVASKLTDTGITYPTYINVNMSISGAADLNGRRDNFIGTLTGCTTEPTVNVQVYQQGNEITLEFLGKLIATSNSTECAITGLPSKYKPQADTIGQLMVQDNGINSVRPVHVAAANGIITVGFGQTLSAMGSKGVVGGTIRFRRA